MACWHREDLHPRDCRDAAGHDTVASSFTAHECDFASLPFRAQPEAVAPGAAGAAVVVATFGSCR